MQQDLVDGIKQILDFTYGNRTLFILGTVYDVNLNVAIQFAKILEAARERDKESLARELDVLTNKLKS